jgi:type I restriction enzyme, R subunit
MHPLGTLACAEPPRVMRVDGEIRWKDPLPMNIEIGQVERKTQRRLIKLFVDELNYEYLGDFSENQYNSNIIEEQLYEFLFAYQEYEDEVIRRAIAEFVKTAGNTSVDLYDRNKAVYEALRYGIPVKSEVGAPTETVWLIDWKTRERNRFALAEEVTVKPPAGGKGHEKRPDLVLYVNGIALGVIELKRSSVHVEEGIRQNLDNQKEDFIQPFFSTMQLVMAGNDSEGLRYWTIQGKEKYYLTWKEDGPGKTGLDKDIRLLCNKDRFLELIHDFIVFDGGTKKICRHNQYFAVKLAQPRMLQREGGIIWNTQGSGKSLIMVWLARWIRENIKDSRVLIITDRTELDEQIEMVFQGVNERDFYRTRSGIDLVEKLNSHEKWLMGSLIHKFGRRESEGENEEESQKSSLKEYIEAVKRALPQDFKAKGNIFVFVDECHRTQSGDLHAAMKTLLPEAVFVGFTGTPLLKTDKKKSVEIFGGYIHQYKFNEAVIDRVVLDLRYEARNIEQTLKSPEKVDQWFESKTRGLTSVAKAQLKKRWGTMQKVLSSQSRLGVIHADILLDMEQNERLENGHGNALLVAGSVYEACKYYELFSKGPLAGKCGIVTSYVPKHADIKGEETGEGATEALDKYAIYQNMLAEFFNEPAEKALRRVEEYEKKVKERFKKEPGRMKLLIVVDKLLTGFDAPSATYLYIDKSMRDHGLFQAICRVNRLDGEDKEYGYIVDYKDLFKSLEGAVKDYTVEALDGYEKEDIAGLLENRLDKAKERLEKAFEAMRALCEPVEPPKDQDAYLRYFSATDRGDAAQLKASEPQRVALYKLTASLIRAYADIANEMEEAGYSAVEAERIRAEVARYEDFRGIVKIHSGDAIDLKAHEPAMRHLIDTYIRAEDSKKVSAFEDLSLVHLVVSRGYQEAVKVLPKSLGKKAAAETVENNVRKVILEQSPINPKYYEKMSQLLESLIEQRRQDALAYEEYLAKIEDIARKAYLGPSGTAYPKSMTTKARRALYDNLGRDEALVIKADAAVRASLQDDWRGNPTKTKMVRLALKTVLGEDEERLAQTLALVQKQDEY